MISPAFLSYILAVVSLTQVQAQLYKEAGPSVSGGNVLKLTRRAPSITKPDGSVDLSMLGKQLDWITAKYQAKETRLREKRGFRKVRPMKRGNPPATLGMHADKNGIFSAPVTIGTPPKLFEMYLDTGSTDLTLPSGDCTFASCGSKTRYFANQSSTAVDLGRSVSSNFADGSASIGEIFNDTIRLGAVSITNQTIISATSLSTTVQSLTSDGIMGLAFNGLSSTQHPSAAINLFSQDPTSAYFSLSLTSSNTTFPAMRFGSFGNVTGVGEGIGRMNGLTWFNVDKTQNRFWSVDGSAPMVGAQQAITNRTSMIFDSGTTLIVAPPDAAAEFWKNVNGSAQIDSSHWTFPCNDPPNVSFTFGTIPPNMTTRGSKKMFTVAPGDLNLGYLPEDPTRCVGAITGMALGLGNDWLLGVSFLKSWFTVFDMALGRVGMAAAVQ